MGSSTELTEDSEAAGLLVGANINVAGMLKKFFFFDRLRTGLVLLLMLLLLLLLLLLSVRSRCCCCCGRSCCCPVYGFDGWKERFHFRSGFRMF